MRHAWVAMYVAALLLPAAARAQQTPGPEPGRGRIGGIGIGAYPQRSAEDPAAVERGKGIYSTNCAFCHGADTRGGDGGPSLLRAAVVLDDKNGELIGPVIRGGRPDRGMPAFALTSQQITDVAAFLHTFRVAGYDPSRERPVSIVVGNAAAGAAFFGRHCAACHSPSGDMQALVRRLPDERAVQQMWLMPGSQTGRGAPVPSRPRPPRVTVTLPSGEKIQGDLERIDDFTVALKTSAGSRRSFRFAPGVQAVVEDPLQAHRDLLRIYNDADIHNVTAYLMTLK